MDSWELYKKSHNIEKNGPNVDMINEYQEWYIEYTKDNPEYTYEYWENQKETIDQWQSIR